MRNEQQKENCKTPSSLAFQPFAFQPFILRPASAMATSPLPQPADAFRRYTYATAEDVAERYFSTPSLRKNQLVWVLTSQGRGIRTELFLRARVVSESTKQNDGDVDATAPRNEEPRVLVRYPKGSTYNVRKSLLLPVLEPGVGGASDRIVLVVPETPEYRRAAVVHTCVGETFVEIGCDYGMCVDRVRKALTEVGDVPLVASGDERENGNDRDMSAKDGGDGENDDTCSNNSSQVACLGVDKSPESIEIAVERYPQTLFSVEDALSDEGTAKMRALCKQKLIGAYPNVVAIDINGNRLLDHVLECIKQLMNPGEDVVLGEDWDLPRLIIVKSRFLHEEVKRRQGKGLQS